MAAIAWVDGHWGTADELHLPLSDRGLQLSDGLFETVLVLDGQPKLLNEHVSRWRAGAELLGMESPPALFRLEPLIEQAIERLGSRTGPAALRLNWSRGDGTGRGIDVSATEQHRFWLTLQQSKPVHRSISTIISRFEQRNAKSRLSRCKTFAYGQAIQARLEARRAGVDDALLRNHNGQLCCGTTANLLVLRGGDWLTPPLESGCLPGVMRGQALTNGICREGWLGPDLTSNDQAWLINSLGYQMIQSVDGIALKRDGEAEAAWTAHWAKLLS